MKRTHFTAIRQNNDETIIANMSFIENLLIPSKEEFFARLKNAVTFWTAVNGDGKKAKAECNGNFNFGDLFLNYTKNSLVIQLNKEGIFGLHIEVLSSHETHFDYDTLLIN
jgi:hypothetical protein